MRDPFDPRVFLSYSRKGGLELAHRLQAILQAEGISLYRDLSDLEGGEDWWRQIETAIKSVEHVVLIVTPQALQSRNVRAEWKLARQEGKSVWPVSGPGDLDLSHLPRWMVRANRHDIDVPDSRGRLIQGLKGPAREKRVPLMADPLPAGFIKRPEKLAEIKKKLLDAQGEPVAITALLRGAPGFGKTALANALCYEPEIEDAFSDGILRVTLGEKPEDLVGRIADLIVALTGKRPDVTHLEVAKTKLAEALDDRRCLLVIDDAWSEEDLSSLLHRGPRDQTARLITARDDRVLPLEFARVSVDAMTTGQALAMLAHELPAGALPSVKGRLTALAARLGEWPLILALVNGVLRTRIVHGNSLDEALSYAERALSQRGLVAAFSPQDQRARRRTVRGTLELSLEQLSEAERTRFAELAVFAEDAEIPTDAAVGLWCQTAQLDTIDGEELLTLLERLSLLIDLDLSRGGGFRLHDVFRSLLLADQTTGRLVELNAKLMAHFRSICQDGDLARLKDVYGLRNAIAHLRGAGESEAADHLLRDPAWRRAQANLPEPGRHVPLRAAPWDERIARSTIDEIVSDALAHFDPEGFWPVHPLDNTTDGHSSLYIGAAGMIWGLDYLRRVSATTVPMDFRPVLPRLLATTQAEMANYEDYAENGSLLLGDLGTAMVVMRLAPAQAIADLIYARAEADSRLPMLELMWGMAGSMLACVHMADMTGEPRWPALFTRQAERLLTELEETKDGPLWTQDLYGYRRQFLGPVHGFAGNMIPLLLGWSWLADEQRERIVDVITRALVTNAWPSDHGLTWKATVDDGRPPYLCQYCHGPPGLVTTFADSPFSSPELEALLVDGGNFTWAAGPLVKGPNLCHGTGGNGYAFLKLHRRTGDPVWLERARAFAMTAIAQCRETRTEVGRGRYTLWTGDIGLAIYLWDCLTTDPRFPSVDIF